MPHRDPKVDEYIEKAAGFAKPILKRLRAAVHGACPEVEEDMKWSFPHFMYKGMLCSMASFKEHAAFGFWKGSLVVGDTSKNAEAMGHLGRLTSLADLPPKTVLARYIKKAAALNDDGVKVERTAKRAAPKPVRVPPDLAAALNRSAAAHKTFSAFSPSHKREYIDWITEARTAPTRERRVKQTIEWLIEGKARNWKYM